MAMDLGGRLFLFVETVLGGDALDKGDLAGGGRSHDEGDADRDEHVVCIGVCKRSGMERTIWYPITGEKRRSREREREKSTLM